MFDGMFLLHYFVEAFLWKFGNPYYRKTLGPLYFDSQSDAAEGASTAPPGAAKPRRRSGFGPLLIAATLMLGLAQSQGWLSVITSRLKHDVIDSMSAENHMGWGSTLAERGDFAHARQHLQRALAYDANNAQATALLEWVDTQMRQRKSGK